MDLFQLRIRASGRGTLARRNVEMKYRELGLYRSLYGLARPYRFYILAIFLVQLLSTPLVLLTPLPLKIAVDSVINGRPLPAWMPSFVPTALHSDATKLLILAACLFLVTAVLTALQSLGSWVLQTYTGEKLVRDFRGLLFRHVQRLSLTYHDVK